MAQEACRRESPNDGKGVRLRQPHQRPGPEPAAPREFGDGLIRPRAACRDKGVAVFFREAPCHAQAKPDGVILPACRLQRAIPRGFVRVDRPDLDAVVPGVADKLGGLVKSHRLRVEDRSAEDIRMMAFHPAGGVGDQREARRVAFGETVRAEAFELAERAVRELDIVAVVDHPLDELVLELVDAARELECRHRAAQLIGFTRRKAGRDHRDLHRLLLKERNAERFAEDLLQFRFGEFDRLLAFPAAQIRVDHVTLDRPGPDDGNLDDKIVETLRCHARQHRHLRTAFDLEDADSIGLADHLVRRRVFRGDGREIEIDVL